MTAQRRSGNNAIAHSPPLAPAARKIRRGFSRRSRIALPTHAVREAGAPRHVLAHERLRHRLRQILASNTRARHFTVRRIIVALGEAPHAPTLALFSSAGAFQAPGVEHLSGVVTGSVGAQLVLCRSEVTIPRAVLKQKIPRHSLVTLIDAVANLLERTEAAVRPRWNWVFHPGVGIALGLVLFLLGVASMIPILSGNYHAASSFMMSIGLAERDGLLVLLGAGAGIASLGVAVANVMSVKQIIATSKDCLIRYLRRLRSRTAAWLLNRIDTGLGDLLRIRWNDALLLFLSVFAGRREEASRGAGTVDRSLKARAERVRLAALQRI